MILTLFMKKSFKNLKNKGEVIKCDDMMSTKC